MVTKILTSAEGPVSRIRGNNHYVEMSAGQARLRSDSAHAPRIDESRKTACREHSDTLKSIELRSSEDVAFICLVVVSVASLAIGITFASGAGSAPTVLLSSCIVLATSLIQPYAVSITRRGKIRVDSVVCSQEHDLEKITSIEAIRNFDGGWKIRLVLSDGKTRQLAYVDEFRELLAAVHDARPSLRIDPWPLGR